MIKPRIIVTGATGKTGRAVTAELLKAGYPVRAMVHREDNRSAQLKAGCRDCGRRQGIPPGIHRWSDSVAVEPVHGEFVRSCGDWSLVQPSTVPPPPICIETYW